MVLSIAPWEEIRSGKKDGAQGRNRTTDTMIFSHVLYQLSYLGTDLLVWGGSGYRPPAVGLRTLQNSDAGL